MEPNKLGGLVKERGYIPSVEVPEDFKLGAANELGGIPLVPDGQWEKWLAPKEAQNTNGVESMNCTSYGTTHALATLMARNDNILPVPINLLNFSDRYVGINAGTGPNGNDPKTVIESIRKYFGLIPEATLPFDGSILSVDDYFSPKPMISDFLTLGKAFITKYKIGYEYVPTNPKDLMKALTYSPVGVAGYAWEEDENGLEYSPNGASPNHWFMLFGYVEDKYFLAFDSYEGFTKMLRWDYKFYQAMRYAITPITPVVKKNWLESILNFIQNLFGLNTGTVEPV
jgi:hypothetical protein